MLAAWQQQWTESLERHGPQLALLAPEGALSFSALGHQAEQWRQHYTCQPHWRVGRCVAMPWHNAWRDLPQLIGLWLAGGVWIAHAEGSCHTELALDLQANLQGPEEGPACWHAIVLSSGSTGAPKLFVRGWRQALQEAHTNAALLDLQPGSHSAMLVNPWFGASTKHLLAGLLSGWCQLLGKAALPLLGEAGGELLYATPSQLQALGMAPPEGPRFSWISLTGEACPASLWPVLQSWSRAGARCFNALGASETGVIAHQILPLDAAWQSFRGVPTQGKQVEVVDEQGVPYSQAGAIGQLQIRGPALIEGQLRKAANGWQLDATPSRAGLMQVLSNDLARWSASGELELLGRSNQLLKRHGEWIDATPLQHALEQQPGVRRCQLLCDPDGLQAWLVLDPPQRAALRKIAKAITTHLDDPRLLPQRLLAVSEFPLNANGKLDMAALQGAGPAGTVQWEVRRRSTKLQAQLDSLDQAQLVSKLQDTNLIWCGGGLEALESTCPAEIGLVALGFPNPSDIAAGDWNLTAISHQLTNILLKASSHQLGKRIWLGGYSLPAWLAYTLALELEKRQLPVCGVVLLDPVDPWRATYRLRWRRALAHWWRTGPGASWYRGVTTHRLQTKSWRQGLIGAWVNEGRPSVLQNPLWIMSSSWPGRLSHRHASRCHPQPRWVELSTHSHEAVVGDPEILNQWIPMLWKKVLESR